MKDQKHKCMICNSKFNLVVCNSNVFCFLCIGKGMLGYFKLVKHNVEQSLKSIDEPKLIKYLSSQGLSPEESKWDIESLKVIIPTMDFNGDSTGELLFNKDKSGRRYIQFLPEKCYLD